MVCIESDTSQLSHWSWSIGSINSSIDDLKFVLKNQDQQVITLIRENEDLRNELKNKNKEIKKQKCKYLGLRDLPLASVCFKKHVELVYQMESIFKFELIANKLCVFLWTK